VNRHSESLFRHTNQQCLYSSFLIQSKHLEEYNHRGEERCELFVSVEEVMENG